MKQFYKAQVAQLRPFLTKLDPSIPPSRAEVTRERTIDWEPGKSDLSKNVLWWLGLSL